MPKNAKRRGTGKDAYFSVEIWSAEEMKKDEPFTLGCYDTDINEVVAALEDDDEFAAVISNPDNPNFIREIVAHVLCAHTRQTVRKYGVGH